MTLLTRMASTTMPIEARILCGDRYSVSRPMTPAATKPPLEYVVMPRMKTPTRKNRCTKASDRVVAVRIKCAEERYQHHRSKRYAVVVSEKRDDIVVLAAGIQEQLDPALLGALEAHRVGNHQHREPESMAIGDQRHDEIAGEDDLREVDPIRP